VDCCQSFREKKKEGRNGLLVREGFRIQLGEEGGKRKGKGRNAKTTGSAVGFLWGGKKRKGRVSKPTFPLSTFNGKKRKRKIRGLVTGEKKKKEIHSSAGGKKKKKKEGGLLTPKSSFRQRKKEEKKGADHGNKGEEKEGDLCR